MSLGYVITQTCYVYPCNMSLGYFPIQIFHDYPDSIGLSVFLAFSFIPLFILSFLDLIYVFLIWHLVSANCSLI
jgi:hypothetical protein